MKDEFTAAILKDLMKSANLETKENFADFINTAIVYPESPYTGMLWDYAEELAELGNNANYPCFPLINEVAEHEGFNMGAVYFSCFIFGCINRTSQSFLWAATYEGKRISFMKTSGNIHSMAAITFGNQLGLSSMMISVPHVPQIMLSSGHIRYLSDLVSHPVIDKTKIGIELKTANEGIVTFDYQTKLPFVPFRYLAEKRKRT